MPHTPARARRNVTVLVIAQAFVSAQLLMIFIIAGLAGKALSVNPCWATLPISCIVIGSMTTAPWLSQVMQRWGRKIGFYIAAIGGTLGAAISAYALNTESFTWLLVGSYLSGIYMSSAGFYRFAATDTASPEFRPKAVSYVLMGGWVAAIFGAQLVKITTDITDMPFFGTYVAIIALNVLSLFLFAFLDIPVPKKLTATDDRGRSYFALLKTPRIAVAVLCAMVSYGLMNFVMTSAPLAIVDFGFSTNQAADVVMAHVLGMFVPSIFTGFLIVRFGAERIIGAGLLILLLAAGVHLMGLTLPHFFGGMIFLGIGWNFGFIGATAMLTSAHRESERGRVEGMNDFLVFGFVAISSLASGGIMNCRGGSPAEGWQAVNISTAPLLMLAAGALVWLIWHDNDKRLTIND